MKLTKAEVRKIYFEMEMALKTPAFEFVSEYLEFENSEGKKIKIDLISSTDSHYVSDLYKRQKAKEVVEG